jgi:hypothetical protein
MGGFFVVHIGDLHLLAATRADGIILVKGGVADWARQVGEEVQVGCITLSEKGATLWTIIGVHVNLVAADRTLQPTGIEHSPASRTSVDRPRDLRPTDRAFVNVSGSVPLVITQ